MTYVVNVASNVCGSIPSTIPVNIDCSLCAIGFPQAGGFIGLQFFGPVCPPATEPSPSWWLGSSLKQAQWKCINPGPNAEPTPNTWVASGLFGSIATTSGCARQYRFRATLTVVTETTIQVAVVVEVLVPSGGGHAWTNYVSWTETLTEIAGTDTTAYRSRSFATVGHTPITVNQVGGKGDPVSFARIIVGMQSMRIGCGGNGDVCGLWDGTQWLTCLRGFIKSTPDNSIREFVQLGFNPQTCGTTNACGCDRIVLTSTSPVAGTCVNNTAATFVPAYGVLGLPGGIESIGAVQQIQRGPSTDCGIEIVVKQVNNGVIYICTNDNGAGWICSAATVAQAKGPRILTATRADFEVYLYALNFPNDNLLPVDCYDGGGIPTPGEGDPWWCVDNVCVQAPLQPAGAMGGPYPTEEECAIVCAGIDPPDPPPQNDPWWCVANVACVQSPTELVASTGPHATLTDCELVCPLADENGPGFYCVYVADSWDCLYYEERPAGHTGLRFFTYFNCAYICSPSAPPPAEPDPAPELEYYCTFTTGELSFYSCQQLAAPPAPGSNPAFVSGPYATYNACDAACATEAGLQYWCVAAFDGSLGCAASVTPPAGWVGGPFATLAACEAVCDGGMAPEQAAPAAMLPPEPTPVQAEAQRMLAERRQPLTTYQLQLIERAKNPCRHRGEFIGEANCGCSGKKLYACALHGQCRLMPNTGDGADIRYCDKCPDYAR